MRRVKLVIQYEGTHYSGWQRQPGANTVQGELEKALRELTQEAIETFGASRTDAGVHALGQVAHFDDAGKFPIERYQPALNALLPEDIGVLSAQEVSQNFHARFDPVKKWYRYYIYVGKEKPIFQRRTAIQIRAPLNIEAMQKAGAYLVGTHDVTSFKSLTPDNQEKDSVRTLFRVDVKKEEAMVIVDIEGDGFLYKMVRGIVGTLLEVGKGKETPEWVKTVLEARDRQKAGANLPPEGLFLMEIFYKKG